MKERRIVWKSQEYPGLEYLYILEESRLIQAVSDVIAVIDRTPIHLSYVLAFDAQFTLQRVSVSEGARGGFTLSTDGRGNWLNEKRQPLRELAGCFDVDISATPFTNTLPIRRLQWQPGQSETFRMVYILVPELTVSVDPQRYTCLERNEQGGVFRFESLDSGFTADITVDADGLVVHYPGLFERVV